MSYSTIISNNRLLSLASKFTACGSLLQCPTEYGRYHLYISYTCPWASRCLSYLKIKGLDDAISFSVYAVHLKCNQKLLREYPNLFNYTKDIFQVPGMSSTVNMNHIKQHYYGSHPSINPFGIIPHGPNIDYSLPHDLRRFSK
ncbi:unnamed protein product [Eruca vesicaria subsp. sativa]|uniref:GST N-terminal domain-containing protein n=1 Tax=Eruca vesicaria subsp. sativa TaxID=29727 RepID=A0ABC8K6E1_ERUVS|nr:unnamed protein product [Eruca vesicaria subsp. sativa]